MKNNMKYLLLFFLIFIGFAHLHAFEKFHNYYEKGLSYMQKGDCYRAIEEFKSASSLEFNDVKRKRTYGIKFYVFLLFSGFISKSLFIVKNHNKILSLNNVFFYFSN